MKLSQKSIDNLVQSLGVEEPQLKTIKRMVESCEEAAGKCKLLGNYGLLEQYSELAVEISSLIIAKRRGHSAEEFILLNEFWNEMDQNIVKDLSVCGCKFQ
jgi:hypothetical protein